MSKTTKLINSACEGHILVKCSNCRKMFWNKVKEKELLKRCKCGGIKLMRNVIK